MIGVCITLIVRFESEQARRPDVWNFCESRVPRAVNIKCYVMWFRKQVSTFYLRWKREISYCKLGSIKFLDVIGTYQPSYTASYHGRI
jgi:hypothetical protein